MLEFFKKRVRSFVYAFRGIWTFFSTEVHPKIHLLALVIISLMGWWLGLSALEWCLIVLCFALVLMAEAFNTALEFLVDLVSPDYHELAGKAKDVAAGAVLITVILCGIVWGIIFLPKLWAVVMA
jgi:diacylglycerol kinase (ATP)